MEKERGEKEPSYPKIAWYYLKFGHYVLLECLRFNSDIQAKLPEYEEELLILVDAIDGIRITM
eukprot:15330698-Ditylum_brightwellii.AAC.1